MAVKRRFGQTEAGVIPQDWKVADLAWLTDPRRPISYGIVQTGPNVPNGVRCLRVLDVNDGRINKTNLVTTTKEISEAYKRTILKTGDLVMPLRGNVGDVALVDGDLAGCNLTRGVALLAIRPEWSALFCKQSLSSSATRSRLEQSMNGSALQEIPIATLRRFKIALPPTKAEQESIAEALSDADAFLESLEQLIAKKRHLKQGAMQVLLTGEKRLPGFSREWEVKSLREIGDIASAGVDKKSRPDEVAVRLVNYLDVYHKDFICSYDLTHWATAPVHQARRCDVREGDVFFTPSSETRDDIAISAVALEDIPDAAYSYHVTRLRLRYRWDLRYRAYAFKTRAFLALAEKICDGSGTRYTISQGKFKSMTVRVPPFPEQRAIATVLSDMDAEIAALETKLAKARLVKQGMMQELLTGKIRLI